VDAFVVAQAARTLIWIVVAALVGGLLILVVIGLIALGPSNWWSTLADRRLETEPYDLLFSTIVGANTVMIALFFTVAGALIATTDLGDLSYYSNPSILWPALLESYCVAALVLRAWGFPPFSGALLGLAVLGTVAWIAYIALARHFLTVVLDARKAG
jgi:hypothetical protein